MSEMKEIEQDMNALTEDVADELNLPARSVTLEYLNTLGHFFRMTTKVAYFEFSLFSVGKFYLQKLFAFI